MNNETRIGKLIFSTALAAIFCLCSCSLKQHTPEPEPQPEPQPETVAFRATSQATWVKSTTTSSTLSDYHNDFGVWGIARKEGASDYILWSDDELTQVVKNTATGAPANEYKPVSDAYWFSGYTYNFIAIAPYTNSGVVPTFTPATASTKDAMSFTYNLGNKYALKGTAGTQAKDHYEFDLMAAVAETPVEKSSAQGAQSLTFWHLFAQININVIFVNASGATVNTGTVSEMRLLNVDSEANYLISFTNTGGLAVSCQSNTTAEKQQNLTFPSSSGTVNVLPQNISDFELYIDFTIDEGTAEAPRLVSYTDFKVNLNIQNATTNPNGTNPAVYNNNESYTWTIKIGPKEDISFKVNVAEWNEAKVGDNDIDII